LKQNLKKSERWGASEVLEALWSEAEREHLALKEMRGDRGRV